MSKNMYCNLLGAKKWIGQPNLVHRVNHILYEPHFFKSNQAWWSIRAAHIGLFYFFFLSKFILIQKKKKLKNIS